MKYVTKNPRIPKTLSVHEVENFLYFYLKDEQRNILDYIPKIYLKLVLKSVGLPLVKNFFSPV